MPGGNKKVTHTLNKKTELITIAEKKNFKVFKCLNINIRKCFNRIIYFIREHIYIFIYIYIYI